MITQYKKVRIMVAVLMIVCLIVPALQIGGGDFLHHEFSVFGQSGSNIDSDFNMAVGGARYDSSILVFTHIIRAKVFGGVRKRIAVNKLFLENLARYSGFLFSNGQGGLVKALNFPVLLMVADHREKFARWRHVRDGEKEGFRL